MSRQVVVVEPGQGQRVGNVEFLARTVDTPYFNLAAVDLRPGQGVDGHRHEGEDDSFLVVEGTLSLTVGDDERVVHAGPGTYVLVPAGTYHALANHGPDDVRFLNVHAPGGFDRRIGIDAPPPAPRRRLPVGAVARPLALLALLLAVVLATGSGGMAAAALAKASVGSKQIKDGGVRTQDLGIGAVRGAQIGDGSVTGTDLAAGTLTSRELADGSLTGAEVADDSLTGAEVDESTLVLPATPSVAEGQYGSGTMSNYPKVVATLTVDVPRDGFMEVSASSMFGAAAESAWVQAELYQDDALVRQVRWDAGDKDGQLDQQQTVQGVVPVSAGTHTYELMTGEALWTGTGYSIYVGAQVVVRFFPEGSAPVGAG